MSGGSSRSAASVSYSFTVKKTMSTGPIAEGSSVAYMREVKVSARALDLQTTLAQSLEVRAPRNETHVGAACRETAAEVPADAAAAENRDAHGKGC